MIMAQQAAPVLGVALGDAILTRLLQQQEGAFSALESIVEATAGVIYLGGDRFRENDGAPYLDPLFAAQHLLTRLPRAAALISTSPDVEHPFNYARRTLAVDHYSAGRLGIVLGSRDRRTPRKAGDVPWTGTPAGPGLAAEFITVLRQLWNSWPRESIIADGENGIFADSSQIVSINHEGAYDVAGPLNTPSSVQGEPPLGWHITAPAEREAAAEAELLITEAGSEHRVEIRGADGTAAVASLISITSPEGLRSASERLPSEAPAAAHQGTLRERLGLKHRGLDLAAFSPTFVGTP